MTFETFLLMHYGESYSQANVKAKKKLKTQALKELMQLFNIKQPSIWAWDKNGIPADRAIEIVKHYKLDPSCLL